MHKIALQILDVLSRRFDQKFYHFRPPTFTAVLTLRVNILIQWTIKTLLDKKNYSEGLVNTKHLYNSKKNVNALVLGNGPSAGSLNLGYIEELKLGGAIEVFTVNYGLLNQSIRNLKPDYIVLSDGETAPNSHEIRSVELWETIAKVAEIRVISPIGWHKKFTQLIDCERGECLHFVDSSLEGISNSTSPLKARGYSSMTAWKALAFAIHMGYERIFCAGIDASNFKSIEVNSKNRLIQHARHLTSNYMNPQDISDSYPNGMSDYLADYASQFYSLRVCFASKGVINLARESELDVFPKISIKDPLFKLVK